MDQTQELQNRGPGQRPTGIVPITLDLQFAEATSLITTVSNAINDVASGAAAKVVLTITRELFLAEAHELLVKLSAGVLAVSDQSAAESGNQKGNQ